MMVPSLTASWLGSLYERKHRADHGWGSIGICALSSAFFAAAPVFLAQLYEEKLTAVWAAALFLMACGVTGSVRKWIRGTEEPAWN